jgi:phage recombination protein Bet
VSQAIATDQREELSLVQHVERNLPIVDYSHDQLQLIKDVYAKGATDVEFKLFVEIARRKGLDIFSNQIFLVKRYDSSLQKEVMRAQTSIDGYRLIADRTQSYTPGRKTEFTHDEKGNVLSATAFIKKRVGNEWHEISAEVWFEEYKQTKKDGTLTVFWKKMPHVMLGKCAEAVTLRKAFPADLSGLYTTDEMGQADVVIDVTPESPALTGEPQKQLEAGEKKPNGNGREKLIQIVTDLDNLIREIRGFGISNADIQARMKDLVGVDKRADLNEGQMVACIEEFEDWAARLELDKKGGTR